jgi:hypothetical protein
VIKPMQLVTVDKDVRYLSSDNTEPQMANKEVIVGYLTGAPTVTALRTFVFDEIEPERRHPVSLTFSSDGQWIWSGLTTYYVERYDVRLPQDFVQWILESGTPPSSLPHAVRDEAMSLAHASIG